MAFLVGTGRRLSAASLVALLAASAGCQLVFGLDDYGPRPAGQGGGGASSPSTSTTTSSSGCAPLEPEVVTPGAPGICAVRKLAAFSDPVARELAPGAYCLDHACFVYFERRTAAKNELMCGYCPNLTDATCQAPVSMATGVINPYLRVLPAPEIWVAQGGHLRHAPVNQGGACTVGAFVTITGAVDTGGEIYPAISPNGKVLLFTRTDAAAKTTRIWIARRDDPNGSFDKATLLPGLRDNVPEEVQDLRAQPVWTDGEEAFDTLYFSSTRLSPQPKIIDELDVMVAHRDAGAAFDAPFTDVALVPQLSGPYADFAPVPLGGNAWLWSAGLEKDTPDADLYLLDRGCEPRFTEPDTTAFALVSTLDSDEGAPAIHGGDLFFARAKKGGLSSLYQAADMDGSFGAAAPVPGLMTPPMTSDTEPFPLADGRLLFVSNRSGASKIWIADAAAGTVTRATAEPASVAEGTPFVDEQGALWLAWGGGSDPAGVLAVAPPSGSAWGKAAEVEGLGHATSARDEAPRLLPDGLTLVFASTRPGGFFPGVSTIWAATRPDAASSAWSVFPLPELGGVNGVSGPWIAKDGCSIAVTATGRATSFQRDLAGSTRVLP
jgi:WD40-like Beta Propeller Repeat